MVWAIRPLRRLALVSFVYAGMQTSLSTFLVAYLTDHHDMAIVAAGLVLTAAQAAGAVGRLVWGTIADRFADPRRVLGGLGLGMSGCALAAGTFTPAWPLAAILVVCVAFGATAVAWNGIFIAQIARLVAPGRAGEATGAAGFFTFVGITTIPALFSVVLATTGSYGLGFGLVAALTLAGGVWLLRPDGGSRDGKP
jgi:nitrate/nitrite transporter NarK